MGNAGQRSAKAPELPVAIVGAGFSGTLLAINLLRNGARVVLVEREDAQLAKGLAFGTRKPEHLLNVRAANMSAFPDDAGHFLRWMGFSTTDQANQFVPRLAYGHYLRELLLEALSAASGRAEILTGDVAAARLEDDRIVLTLGDGDEIACRELVLAQGNFRSPPNPAFAHLPDTIHFADPWSPGVTDGLEGIEDILLLGSSLTAVDIVLSLESAGYRGRITALSRRGLKPLSHAESGPVFKSVSIPAENGASLIRRVRRRAAEIGWRHAIDELRLHTQQLWRRHDHAGQRSLLRHLRPYWDIHRHRLAPGAARRIAALEEAGRLRFIAGKLASAEVEGDAVRAIWRLRGNDRTESLLAGRIVGCTGPEGDLAKVDDPLLQGLIAAGHVRPDAHRLGIDVDRLGRVRNSEGKPQPHLFAVGPATKGEAWEIVAVPDIRRQVWDLARQLTNAHWVGGEGL